MKMRNINIQSGNYNENVSGDYEESKSIVTETVIKDGKVTVTKTITTTATDGTKTTIRESSSEPIHKAQSVTQNINAEGAGSFNLGDIFGTVANTINNIKQAATTKSMIIGEKTMGISKGHTVIGNSNAQIVQGNNNQVVQQSIQSSKYSTNIQSASNLHIGDIVERDALDKARDFNENIDEYLDNLEVNNDSKEEFKDFWLTEEQGMIDPRLSVFFDVFYDQLEIVVDKPTPHKYVTAVLEMVEYFELAPAIMQYVLDNQSAMIDSLQEGNNSEIAVKLFNKLIVSLDI